MPAIVVHRMDLGWLGYVQAFAFVLFGISLRRASDEDSPEARLQAAIESRDTIKAKSRIDEGADVNKRIAGETALGWAVLHANLELVEYLLACGANVHQRTGEDGLIQNAELGKAEADTAEEKLKYDAVIEVLRRRSAAPMSTTPPQSAS